MIAIFCEFCQFSAKKLAFFSKTSAMIKFLQKLAVVGADLTTFGSIVKGVEQQS
jgi:hypothetical protein